MGRISLIFFLLVFIFDFSCAYHPEVKPVPGAERIKVYEVTDPAEKILFKMEKQYGCRMLLKDIITPPSIKKGIYENHVDEEIEIIGRNKAVKTGGNVLILEMFRKIPEVQLNVKYTGKIIVLKCP
ncbi:hypothetical protein GWK41_07365 [Persephonella atlantica]|uniref:Lipoprotein n=1 Tax=Persephonella atlantica TaxID=2699429 RepID=A0ABS1GIX2_9AQUI|nr:hypothetical protein [Persephonella atlantica]MBK3332884.1 hypothetical protein [Persephonella atlantica]